MLISPVAIQGVIVDLDGTMIDTAGDFTVAINLMRNDLELPPLTQAEVIRYVGKGSEELVRQILLHDLPLITAGACFDYALECYARHYQDVNGKYSRLFPGVREGLVGMQAAGLKMACVTNKPYRFAESLLTQFELRPFFDVLIGGDSLAQKKPHPLPFLTVSDYFKLPPNCIIAIGDSSNDVDAARAAGCPVLLLPYGYNHGQSIQDIECDGIVDTLYDVIEFLHLSPTIQTSHVSNPKNVR